MLEFLQDPTVLISLTAVTAGGAYAISKYKKSKNRVDNAPPESSPVPTFRNWEPLNPYAEIIEVRGSHVVNHVTVVYGIKSPEGKLIPDHQLITCIHIPSYLPEAHLSNGPITQPIDPLPEGWREYLLSRQETLLIK